IDGQWRRLNHSLSSEEVQQLGNSLMTTLPSGWNNAIIK
ncbi:MAG TPA: arginyltransferase, partial [Acinetobacter johnsonii]|nr:arginyltransferase [Acinetobacter johnsonii]